MNTHLAHESERAYVFQQYQWKPDYHPWVIPPLTFRETRRFPNTPLNALISGPTAGGSWERGDDAPRSISERWFEVVCPVDERRIIYTRDVKPAVAEATGDVVFAHWKKLLLEAPERCIEIVPSPLSEESFPQTFDLFLWGSERILPLWEPFSKSSTSRLLEASPIVKNAISQNEALFLPRAPRHAAPPAATTPYPHMMAVHVRLGDFKKACYDLATWNSTFYSWNLLPFLPDKFVPPPGGSWGKNTEENTQTYMLHCQPTLQGILRKISDARTEYVSAAAGRRVDVIYLMTNEKSTLLTQLKSALKEHGWSIVTTSMDLKLTKHQIDVGMAVDMEIARRAAVFIGNGVCLFYAFAVRTASLMGFS